MTKSQPTKSESSLARILVIADDEGGRATLRGAVDAAGVEATLDELPDGADMVAGLADGRYDCALLASTDAAVARIRAAGLTTPVVYVDDDGLAPRLRHALRLGHAERELATVRAQLDAAHQAAARAAHAHTTLLSIVSHDLRGPLSAINVALDGLGDDEVVGADRQRYVASVQRSVEKANRLIKDLVTAEQIDAGTLRVERHPVLVKALVEQAARDSEQAARQANMPIVTDIDPTASKIFADRDQLLQAISNLLTNALRHARGSGPIELSARLGDRVVELIIRDHGPGIVEELRPHIFDRHWPGRERRGGAGLGLAIAQGIARSHGGQVSYSATEGGGATFTLQVPTAG